MALIPIVVLGVIGMHGIGLHGSQHADPGDLTAPSAASEMPAMTGHDATPATHGHGHIQQQDAATSRSGVAALASPLDLGHGMAGMAILCIAILVGAALAWTLARSQRSASVLVRRLVMTSTAAARRAEVRQTGPPMDLAFTVIRC